MNTDHNRPGRTDWQSDFFGTLNEMPTEPLALISEVLETMGTLPAYQNARRWVLQNMGLSVGSSILEAGCGTGVSLPDVVSVVGRGGRIRGIDPTQAFVQSAMTRAQSAGATDARYEPGDIRALPVGDGEFDACFCDKVLIHAGPARTALAEMTRVTRQGGSVGAIEWLPFFALSSRQTEALETFNAIFRKAVHDYQVSANLARHFRGAGLSNVRVHALIAHTDSLDAHPFWRAFLLSQLPLFIHAGLIDEATAHTFARDVEDLNARGEFSASFMVQAAVGTK